MTDQVTAMLEARSVALVGASARPGSLGARMIDQVARSPSRPRTYLVNPRYPDIGGTPCLPSLAEVPEPVDLALLAVPDTTLEDQLGLAARTKARSAVIFGNAFDADGTTGLRGRLAAIAADAGMALCGAGCMGSGKHLVSAHSGALAAADGAWEALAGAYGLHRVRDLAELADTLEVFAAGRRSARNPQGIATVHDSGLERAHVADLAGERNVPFAPISPATTQRLAQAIDPGLTPGNPLDVWGTSRDTEPLFAECLAALAADPQVAAVVLAVDPVAAARLRAAGVPVLEGTRTGLLAVRHLLDHTDHTERPEPPRPAAPGPRRQRWAPVLSAGPPSGAVLFDLLRDYGIPAVRARAADTRAGALAAAAGIGYPVVLKTDEPGIAHKSDVGGVRLGLAGPDAAGAAYDDLAGRLGPRVLICETAAPGTELALGLIRDAALGPLLVISAGGVLIEIFSERAVVLPPVTRSSARVVLARLRLGAVLAGARGQRPADLDAIAAAITGLSELAADLGELLDALDINPLICGPSGAVAADVLAVIRPSRQALRS